MTNRYTSLDSLRGLAAFSVVLSHIFLVFPIIESDTRDLAGIGLINLFKYSPFHIIWGGQEAVLFFFILSGFVLSLPYWGMQGLTYKAFILKRICRIYIPYLTAIFFSLFLRTVTVTDISYPVSDWFSYPWTRPYDIQTVFKHILLIVNFDTTVFNGVIWSLVYEMRISIVFPLLLIVIKKTNWLIGLLFCLMLSNFPSKGFHYSSMFIIGALVARHKDQLILYFQSFTSVQKVLLLVSAVFLYTARWTFYASLDSHVVLREYIIASGIVIFIISSLSYNRIEALLHLNPIVFLGKISYSLYLFHMPIMLAMVYKFSSTLPMPLILFFSVVASLGVATIIYYLIEKPSIKLGRKLSKRLKKGNITQSSKPAFVAN